MRVLVTKDCCGGFFSVNCKSSIWVSPICLPFLRFFWGLFVRYVGWPYGGCDGSFLGVNLGKGWLSGLGGGFGKDFGVEGLDGCRRLEVSRV